MTPPADDFPCNEFVELVTAYLDGALPEADVRRLEEHLEICQGCETVLEQFHTVIRMSGRLSESDVDALRLRREARDVGVPRLGGHPRLYAQSAGVARPAVG